MKIKILAALVATSLTALPAAAHAGSVTFSGSSNGVFTASVTFNF
jgi:hypothetical protein